MALRGESEAHSFYVVQRAFRIVRRGYDPAEVDRHLQVVSEWFRQSRAGDEAREFKRELHARSLAVAELEQQAQRLIDSRRVEAEATLDGARLRASAEIEAAQQALREAEMIAEERRQVAAATVARARVEAERLRGCALDERSAILAQARLDAQAAETVREAQESARGIIASAVREADERARRIIASAEAQADRIAAGAKQARERELLTARTAAAQLLAAMRSEAAEEARALRAQAEEDARDYVKRRHREVDRLVDAARR